MPINLDWQLDLFRSKPKPTKVQTFDDLAALFREQFAEKRFAEVGEAPREMRENVLELASPSCGKPNSSLLNGSARDAFKF
ncbi:hypothetical protein NKJ46_28270 [Mesorhizobium sp. M0166]|uniref:hypothetical protein n=1 Tax=Mesorhizobium sp. M0166 TaxID=2956902 RepID=UPI00333C2357